jgi:hypothetical protein
MNIVEKAQAAGMTKGKPNGAGQKDSTGNGLKQAWADQTKKPSAMVNLAMAKKKVR